MSTGSKPRSLLVSGSPLRERLAAPARMGPPLTPPAARVALCLPTRNRAGYLRQAIESALNQTYRDFSLLVSDNASTDNTPDVVASIDDRRLSYVRLERDVGWCGNFNNCLDCAPAGAEYAIILGDDDLLHPRFLERTVEVLDREASTAFVHTGFDLVDGGGRLLRGGVNWMRTTAQDILEPGMTLSATRCCGRRAYAHQPRSSGWRLFPAYGSTRSTFRRPIWVCGFA